MGWLTGFEPATLGTTNRCSNQLSYSHHPWKKEALKIYWGLDLSIAFWRDLLPERPNEIALALD